MASTAETNPSKYVLNKKVSSKKYIESLLNDSDAEDNAVDDSGFNSSKELDHSVISPTSTAAANSSSNSVNLSRNNSSAKSSFRADVLRSDSSGSGYSHKKKEGVSNSIKALQDKIKKGLDLNEPADTIRSPTLSTKSYRSNFEKSIKSPLRSSENSPRLDRVKNQKFHQDANASYNSHSYADDNSLRNIDFSVNSVNPSSPEPVEDKSFNTSYNTSHNYNYNYNGNTTITSVNSSSENVPLPKSSASSAATTAPAAPTATVRNTKHNSTKQASLQNHFFDQDDYEFSTKRTFSDTAAVITNKKKITIPQFKVVRKSSSSAMNDSPKSPAASITSVDVHQNHDLRQLQLIDKEISKKIKKIKAEVKFIEDSLPPNPCIHDFQSRKKLAAAKEALGKSLEFWEKKKYENGISFSKMSRKVLYSGGEEVMTFFSGRNE